jgi:hypothetical protein
MKTFFYGILLFCLANLAQATGPRVTSALLTPAVNEIFALDSPAVLSLESTDGGVAAALISAAFKVENTESTLTPLPLRTMLSYYLNEGDALGIVGRNLTLSAAELKNVIVIPVLNLKESYFYYRPKHATLAWTGKLADFKNLTVGVNKDDDVTLYKKSEINVEQQRLDDKINALISGKIDVAREADFIMTNVLSKKSTVQQNDIVRLEPNAGEAVVSIVFNKKHSQGAALAKKFQQGLAKILANGEYVSILKNHIGNGTVEQYFVLPHH